MNVLDVKRLAHKQRRASLRHDNDATVMMMLMMKLSRSAKARGSSVCVNLPKYRIRLGNQLSKQNGCQTSGERR